MLTVKQLQRFVKLRNKSGFMSNLQFIIDAEACGFKISDLNCVKIFRINEVKGYEWRTVTKTGPQRLIEFCGRLHLAGEPESGEMIKLMDKAVFE